MCIRDRCYMFPAVGPAGPVPPGPAARRRSTVPGQRPARARTRQAARSAPHGGVAERLIAAVLKTAEGSRLPGVQIPPPPPCIATRTSCFRQDVFFFMPPGTAGKDFCRIWPGRRRPRGLPGQGDAMEHTTLVDAVVTAEWEMFSNVRNVGGKASCQMDPGTCLLYTSRCV